MTSEHGAPHPGGFDDWLRTRPKKIQRMIRIAPPGTRLIIEGIGETWFIVGYTEDDHFLISKIDPSVNYEAAMRDVSSLPMKVVTDQTGGELQ